VSHLARGESAIVAELMVLRNDVWFVDETYVNVNGIWRYVYRAIDQHGQVVDLLVSAHRDAATARRFLQRAAHHGGCWSAASSWPSRLAGEFIDA
jgi:transposase-like protein